MTHARLIKQVVVTTPNEVGQLERVCSAIRSQGGNITHLCASTLGDDARFMIAVEPHEETMQALEKLEFEVSDVEVLEIELENAPGTLEPVARKLSENGVDIEYNYATTGDGQKVMCIMATNDNTKALSLIAES